MRIGRKATGLDEETKKPGCRGDNSLPAGNYWYPEALFYINRVSLKGKWSMKRFLVFLCLGFFPVLAGCGGGGSATSATGITLADIAGTWDYMGSDTDTLNNCSESFRGTITIQSNGSASYSQILHSSCGDQNIPSTSGFTVSIQSDGAGTITFPGGGGTPQPFRVSKNADVMIMDASDTNIYGFQVALKR